jgi:hypothetical protein
VVEVPRYAPDLEIYKTAIFNVCRESKPTAMMQPDSPRTGYTRTSTGQGLTQPVKPISKAQRSGLYCMTLTLYVLADGVPATSAQTFTVMTPADET